MRTAVALIRLWTSKRKKPGRWRSDKVFSSAMDAVCPKSGVRLVGPKHYNPGIRSRQVALGGSSAKAWNAEGTAGKSLISCLFIRSADYQIYLWSLEATL